IAAHNESLTIGKDTSECATLRGYAQAWSRVAMCGATRYDELSRSVREAQVMPVDATTAFVNQLLDSPLLDAAQRDELRRDAPAPGADPRPFARQLVQRGWLTPFQAQEVLHGRTKELTLGPYRLLDRLGEGGMGQVFKARHEPMDRIVALKVIRKERLEHPDAVRRFQREVKAAGNLADPHIVLGYDAGHIDSTLYLAMEYVEGIDLFRLVREQGPLPVSSACDYVRQAALGLHHAHERGLVHRDVKPSNLMLTRDVRALESERVRESETEMTGTPAEVRS